jgi:hypothetical protein
VAVSQSRRSIAAEYRLEAYAPVRIAITNLQTSTPTRLALERYANTLAVTRE